jgi:hypothetical protein
MGVRHLNQCNGIRCAIVWIWLGITCGTVGLAQEVTNFKFTGYEASVSTNVQTDTSSTVTPIANSTDVIRTDQRQTDVRLETSLMTHSYVYHPKFLSLDMGVGIVSSANTLQTNDITVKTREPLYNYSLHGSVLPEKPLHGTFFFDRLNLSPTVGSGESFIQSNDKYGFTTTVMAPLLPVTVLLDVTREENKGKGSVRSLDEKVDRVGVSVRKDISKYGATDVRYSSVNQNSSNGVNGLPVQSSTQDSQAISVDTRFRLGTTTQYDLNNRIEYSTQRYGFTQGVMQELKDARFGLDYRGYHATNLNSFASFQSNHATQDVFFNNSNAIFGGATWTVDKDFDVSGGAHAGNAQATQSSNRSMGVDASTRYSRPLAIGTGAVNYSVRYEKFDQTASNPLTPVLKERVTINKTTDSLLTYRNVNVATIKVWNSNCTVVDALSGDRYCVLGQDYVVTQLGTTTSLRMALGTTTFPIDSAEVLVDYEYENGGTYGSAQVDQSLGFTWTLSPQFNVFARYSDFNPRVTSGNPTIPLSQIKSLWYGLRATVPLSVRYDLVFTGNLDQEDRRDANPGDTNTSYVRTSGEFYLRGELPTTFSNDYRAGMRRVRLVADIATQSVDQTSYELAFGWRTSNGLNLVASALVERDSELLTERDRRTLSLRALWRYRRFFASADLERTRETQDLYARDRTVGRLTLRRDL